MGEKVEEKEDSAGDISIIEVPEGEEPRIVLIRGSVVGPEGTENG